VARVLALVADLMLASRVDGALTSAGHEVTVAASPPADSDGYDLIVADLDLVEAAEVAAIGPPTIGFHAHVDVATKQRAQDAGFSLVVPRSRMSRELPSLAADLLATGRTGSGEGEAS
jgi:hypothetical protein